MITWARLCFSAFSIEKSGNKEYNKKRKAIASREEAFVQVFLQNLLANAVKSRVLTAPKAHNHEKFVATESRQRRRLQLSRRTERDFS